MRTKDFESAIKSANRRTKKFKTSTEPVCRQAGYLPVPREWVVGLLRAQKEFEKNLAQQWPERYHYLMGWIDSAKEFLKK